MRRAANVDANHAEIRDALRKVGLVVFDLSGCGGGVPDLLVCRGGKSIWLEVKDGTKKPSARKLTPAQVEWRGLAARGGVKVHIVESVAQAMASVGLLGCLDCAAGSLEHEAVCGCGCHERFRRGG